MKTGLFYLCIFMLFAFTADARILILNNNGNNTGHYRTLKAVLEAATEGDTIYVVGSSTAYDSTGGTDITKAITIIGPGYYIAENPNTNANLASALFKNELRINSENVFLIGLECNTDVVITKGNFTLRRCKVSTLMDGALTSNISSIAIFQNYIIHIWMTDRTYKVNDIIISNNYILQLREQGINSYTMNNIVVTNNVIQSVGLYGETFNNNIHWEATGDQPFLSQCSVEYNLFSGAIVPATNNNQINVNMANVFVGTSGTSTDGQWKLKSGSPAIGSGFNGVDMGMYGGATPYVLSGIPSIPAVYDLNVQAISTGNALPVQVKIKTNN